MMSFSLTEEEKAALRYYKDVQYQEINQLLISNCETDIALLSEDVEKKSVQINYSRENIQKNFEVIKKIYELMQKNYYQFKRKEGWVFARGTNIAEIERLKNEMYIDNFLSTTKDSKKAELEFSTVWNRPAVMYICGDSNIPYIAIDEVLGSNESQEVIIAPFTKIKEIKECNEIPLEESVKTIKTYSVKIEKQKLEGLSEEERKGLYNYILDNADSVNFRLKDCIDLEKENTVNYENIRKLEQLLSKYENTAEQREIDRDYTDSQRRADLDDIERITKELDELKKVSSEIYEIRKNNINFVTNWKKNVAVYIMAECKEIELKYEALNEVIEEREEKKENIYKEEIKIKNEILENQNYEEVYQEVKKEAEENIEVSDKMLKDIDELIQKQQKYARIAGNLGTIYCALNNGFEMKKVAENLKELIVKIKDKIEEINSKEEKTLEIDKLKTISNVNLQISTLINYLNNPKIAVKNSKLTRFDEMSIIEENELKRGIATKIRDICSEAELKKLKDDLEMLEDKSAISRFFGMFTGKNKLDEFMMEQIEVRQKAIRRTISRKLSLTQNYSIHELIAQIIMFIEENYDDELIEEDVGNLESLEKELKRNFIVLDTKVRDIIEQKEGRNLPIEEKKISRKEMIEIETYRFLHQYGYDILENQEEPAYQNTITNEISRIVEYINTSKVLEL